MATPGQREFGSPIGRSTTSSSPVALSPRQTCSSNGTVSPPRQCERRNDDRFMESTAHYRREGAVVGNSPIGSNSVSTVMKRFYIVYNR